MPATSPKDWTAGPARHAAVIALTLAGAFALASSWSSSRTPSPTAIATPEATAEQAADPRRPPTTINLNTATQPELEALPGIGPSIARRIIERRDTKGPYATVDDLDKVRGIGPVILERIRPYVSVR